jgi:c-di-GMP-binding flagellar brake protein YcgR
VIVFVGFVAVCGSNLHITRVTCTSAREDTTITVRMTLCALLVSADESAAAILGRVLKELRIRSESCPEFPRAAIRAAQERFDVVIVDGPSIKAVTRLLRETRQSRLQDHTLAVVIVPPQEGVHELFSLGVNFVLYRPVSYERALSSLRAAQAVMRKDKRKKTRKAVHAQATVDYANVEQEKATLVDLAENGMAVQFGNRLPPTSKVYFQFKLPGQTGNIRLSGQVVWQEWNGRAGVQFVDVPKTSRRLLDEFLGANLPAEGKREFSDVMVEVEEPVSILTVAEQTHRTEVGRAEQKAAPTYDAAPPALAKDESNENNRRTQARYSCRLGAEVYVTGKSVPNHCCLTDLSAGGCYLEVAIPFPKGSSVEIVVRTYEMKLRLRGTVQASHPGYGMGVVFELKTKEEQANVKKLTDFVAATQDSSSKN